MSLINDALKRAKDAQQPSAPPAPAPQLHPVEPVSTTARGMGTMAPVTAVVIVLVALFLLWQAREKTGTRLSAAQTQPITPINPAPEIKPAVATVAVATPAPAPNPSAIEQLAAPAATAPVVAVPALRLQAIFFAPGRSSAMISGRTVRTGDLVKGYRVVAITGSSATLVSATETNVMTLEQ
jgi:heme/copper-type cytochrome/quinol oxidase subunit 2